MAEHIPQSTSYELAFKAYLTTTGAEATGVTVAITISKDTATSFSNPSGGATNATEIGSGWYFVVLTTTDTGTLGRLAVRGTAATINDVGVGLFVVSASTGGATNLDAAVTTRMATYTQPSGFLAAIFPGTVASTTNITAGTITTVTTVTNQLTAAQIATGVWQDATAGDYTVASSIGKALYTGNVVPGGAGGLFIAGTNAATTITTSLTTTFTGNLSGSVGSVTGLTASNLDTTISSRMASYTQPSGFLAATFPGTVASTTNITAGTIATITNRVTANTDQLAGQTVTAAAGVTFPTSVASPTNITAGTITTATNLTNAPTVGDLTTTMKTSVTTAATAATPTAAAVTGAVGSVAATVSADVVKVTGIAVTGTGATLDPWGP